MTSSTAQRFSRSSAPARTTAQRVLRSLNSLGIIVADSAAEARDREATKSLAALHHMQ